VKLPPIKIKIPVSTIWRYFRDRKKRASKRRLREIQGRIDSLYADREVMRSSLQEAIEKQAREHHRGNPRGR
jgi:hypothetical protein